MKPLKQHLKEKIAIDYEEYTCTAEPWDRMCRECRSPSKNWVLYRLNEKKLKEDGEK